MLNDLYFKTICNIRPHFLGPVGDLKIGPLYRMFCGSHFRLWAVDLYGGNSEGGFEHNTTWASFSIGVTLTESGFEHIQEVR